MLLRLTMICASFLAQAFELMRASAERGHLKAQMNVGLMYEHGRGTPVDMAEAAR